MTSWTPKLDTLIWGLASTQSPADFAPSLELSAAEIRMRLLHLACERVNSGQVALEEAAHVLQISRGTLYRKIFEYNLEREAPSAPETPGDGSHP